MTHLIDTLYLDADDNQYILIDWDGKVSVDKKGYESKQGARYWYCNTMESALKHMVEIVRRRAVSLLDQASIADLKKSLREANKRIEQALKDFEYSV